MVTTNDINQQNKRAEMVRRRDALNNAARGDSKEHAAYRAESQRLTAALGKMPPNAGRAFRRASRERASRVKPVYPLPVVRDNGPTNGPREMERRVRQIAACVISVTG